METKVQQLVEMGVAPAQARAALAKHKDVMEAAERIFSGEFEDIMDVGEDDTVERPSSPQRSSTTSQREGRPRMVTPQDDEVSDADAEDEFMDDADDDGYIDYDSDYDAKAEASKLPTANVDPYAGIFFSKDRREEVIEVEEDSDIVSVPDCSERVKLMTQGQWMKGCPEGGEQAFLFSLYTELSDGSCVCPHSCKYSISRKKSDFFAIYPDFQSYVTHLKQNVRRECPFCKNFFCFACGDPVVPERNMSGVAVLDENPLFHCPNLQGVILGVGLSMLEQLFLDQLRGPAPVRHLHNSRKRKADNNTTVVSIPSDPDDEDDMYYGAKGKKAKGGIGYAGAVREDTTGQVEAQTLQKRKDENIAKLLKAIRTYLPSIHRKGGGKTSDYLVHPTTLAHLRRRFNYVSSTLLRNDSLADMSDRSVLYFELFEWLETISNHEALASMMAMPIMVVSSVKSVSTNKSNSSSPVRERTIVYEGSSGPRELLESIVIQAQAASKGLEGMQPQDDDEEEMTEEQKRMNSVEDGKDKGKGKEKATDGSVDENARLLDFCRRILSTAAAIDRSLRETKGDEFLARLKASLPSVPSTVAEAQIIDLTPVGIGQSEEETKKNYIDWATRIRFEYCDLTLPQPDSKKRGDGTDRALSYKFYFNNEARMLANSDIPRRALAIAKELAVLTTNLPVAWDSSIFLRVDEARVDIIKALITGPEGTPYHNGCFLFDIFLGPSYNQAPPSVKFMTTNGGKYRFNPNLYADGKVCLSLLGTWQGPGWIAGKSTLLQVLISIQSMILCEEPYLNEPGWAGEAGTAQSKAYSANVRRMVVNTAMLGNLKNPPEPFADVIRTHFRLKARTIMAQLDAWVAQDDNKPTAGDGAAYSHSYSKNNSAGGSTNGLQRDVDELKKMLNVLLEEGD